MYYYMYITVKINGPVCPSVLMSGLEKILDFSLFTIFSPPCFAFLE